MNKQRQGQVHAQKQQQKIIPQQIQFLNLLQLPIMELEQRIVAEIEENPALELFETTQNAENTEGGLSELPDEAERIHTKISIDNHSLDTAYSSDGLNQTTNNYPIYPLNVSDTLSFQDDLKQQLAFYSLSRRQYLLCAYIIDMVDEDGYLRYSLEDIADDFSFIFKVFIEELEVESALKIVQSLDPVGIGSRHIKEFMLLQLHNKRCSLPATKIATTIVENHLLDLSHKNFEKIKHSLSLTDKVLFQAIQLLRILKPKPNMGLSQPKDYARHITPDFVVSSNDNGFFDIYVSHNENTRLHINNHYKSLLMSFDNTPQLTKEQKENRQFLQHKVTAAQLFIDALQQREHSLIRTIYTIVDLQQSFFKTGRTNCLRPMVLKDVAQRVDLDISTISRVTSLRYVQTDFGIFPLKDLFTEGILTDDGKIVSNRVIQEALIDIINAENKANPLNDQEIATLLAETGYSIARRTVAKYRDHLNIPTAILRREFYF